MLSRNNVVNAILFQVLWFACVIGGAQHVIWPAVVSGIAMSIWQLHPSRRHVTDLIVLLAALVLGLIIDSSWIMFGLLEFNDSRPFALLAPGWILIMWIGFGLTINHSMAWLMKHPALPPLMGFIGGPLAYFAGLRLGAVEYQIEFWTMSLILGVIWAIVLIILVKIARIGVH